jgi:hypothetical protein
MVLLFDKFTLSGHVTSVEIVFSSELGSSVLRWAFISLYTIIKVVSSGVNNVLFFRNIHTEITFNLLHDPGRISFVIKNIILSERSQLDHIRAAFKRTDVRGVVKYCPNIGLIEF